MNIEKLGALGAQGVAAGAMLAWVGLVYVTRPVSSGGIDPVAHLCLAAASFAPLALMAAAHAWFAQQLKHGPDSIRG
ncbi:MAG: hypothetical protein K8S21_00275 [Gemmatimonadetes bacterium]|nr:hypothetical protein [Gemmatimonadota bacterium]